MGNTQSNCVDYKRLNDIGNGNVSDSSRKSLQQAKNKLKLINKGKKVLDNPPKHHSPLFEYLENSYKMMCYMRKNGLSYAAFNTLLYVYRYFVLNSIGVSAYYIAKDLLRIVNPDKEMQNVRLKLDRLCDRGLCVRVGKSDRGASLYIPSVKSVEDIENIFK